MDVELGIDVAGVALSAVSVVVPTILATVFYVMIAAAPGGIQYGSSGQCKLLRKKALGNRTNHVNNHGSEEVEAGEVIEELDAPEEPIEEPEEEIVEEEVAEVPIEPPEQKKKKNKKKSAPVREEEPVVEEPVVEEFVEEVAEEVVEAPQKKKKNKKNKAAPAPEPEPAAEVVEETVEYAEEAVAEEQAEEAVEEAVEEAAEAVPDDCQAEEAAEEAQEESPEKGKKKRNRKPKTSKAFLAAQSFRKGPEDADAGDAAGGWEEYHEEEWATVKKEVPKKEKKEKPAQQVVEEVAEPAVEEAVEVEEPMEEEAQVQEEEAVDEIVELEEEEEQQEEEELPEVEAEEAADEEDEPVAEEEEEDEDEEEEQEDAAEEDENAEGVDSIDVVYQKRRTVKQELRNIQDKTGVRPITEIGGEFTIKGPKSGRKQALQAINDIVNKGYTLLSWDDPAEKVISFESSRTGELIGPKGSIINKIRHEFNVEMKLPEQSASVKKTDTVQAYVAGGSDDVEKAAQVINEILDFGFSPVTHPGTERKQMAVDQFQKPFIIGKKGVEIKKIKETFNVKVDIPTDLDIVTIMGQSGDVKMAREHIAMLLDTVEDKVQKKREEAEKAAAEAAEAARLAEEEAAAANAEAEAEEDKEDGDEEEEDDEGEDEEEEDEEDDKEVQESL